MAGNAHVAGGLRYFATFLAQAWVNKHTAPVDPQGDTGWEVTDWMLQLTPAARRQVLHKDAEPFHFNDEMRAHPSAPQWVKDWSGPFEIDVTAKVAPFLGYTTRLLVALEVADKVTIDYLPQQSDRGPVYEVANIRFWPSPETGVLLEFCGDDLQAHVPDQHVVVSNEGNAVAIDTHGLTHILNLSVSRGLS